MIKRLLCAAALCVAVSASAGVNEWSAAGPEGGSAYGGVQFLAAPRTAVAVTLHGIYRTTDRGENWTRTFQFSNYLFYGGLAASPTNANLVIAHGDGSSSILRSADGGLTWTPREAAGLSKNVSAAAFTRDGSVVWAGTSDGRMLRSSDGGLNWTPRSTGLALTYIVEQIEVDATDPQRVYLVSNGQIWRTTNDGANWTLISGADHYYRIAASRSTHHELMGLRPALTWGVYVSTNGGDTFLPTAAPGGSVIAIEYVPTLTRVVGITDDRRVVYTDDQGATWHPKLGKVPPGTPMRMSFDALGGPDALLVATNAGIAYSADSGGAWEARGNGIHELEFGRLVTGASAPNYLYATAWDHNVIYRRNSATGAWDGIAASALNLTGPGYQSFAFADSATTPRTLSLVKEGRFARSINDGASWTSLGQVGDGRSLAVDPTNAQIAYAGGISMPAMKTIDGGANWAPLAGGLPVGIEDIIIDPSTPLTVYAAKSLNGNPGSAIYRSTDGGTSWSPRDTGIVPDSWLWRLVMHPTNPQILYATAQSGVWKTINGGASWSNVFNTSAIFDLAIDPQSPNIVYISSNGQANVSARSVDGGATWEPLRVGSMGVANPAGSWIALVPGQPSTLIHARASFGLYEMEIAPDVQASSATTILKVGVPENVTVTVNNAGVFSATNVAVSIALPANSGVMVTPGGANCTQAPQVVHCSIPVLKPAQSVPIIVALTPTTHAAHLSVMASAYEPDSQASNNTFDIATERQADLRAQLTSSADSAQTGTTFSYGISLTNLGPSPAAGVVSTLQLPANVTFASATATGLTCAHNAGTVTCAADSVAIDATATATITVNAVTAGAAIGTLSAAGEGTDPAAVNNTASRTVTLTNPPPPPPPPPPPVNGGGGNGGGGGGGGGAFDYLLLLGLALYALRMQGRLRVRRH